jgi:stress-induced morphogen
MTTRRQDIIENRLRAELAPTWLQVANESSGHAVPKGSETHFKVVVVSDQFQGLSRIARHQLVYRILGDELRAGLHALSLTCRTIVEWEQNPDVLASPACEGRPRPS